MSNHESPLHSVAPAATPGQTPPAIPLPVPTAPSRKQRLLLGAGAAVGLLVAAVATHAFLTRGDQSTDDAQVEADVVAVAPRVGGTVLEVLVGDNATVKAGQPLLRLDDADFRVRVRQAEAEVETARSQAAAADAQITAARASVTRAEAEAERAALELRRAEDLKAGDAIAADRYDATRTVNETARAGAGVNRAQYAAALANANLAHARVRSAQASLDLARLQLSWTEVRAPADGTLSRLGARAGQIVQPGQPLGQLVPDQTYVVANFKETQLGSMHPGQRVDVAVDSYPGRKLAGRVESISAGTGARFSLLPPDNASGNFVKVVERVPVRIAWIDPPADLRLRAGLSVTATVHTR
jgi:membrane fusion protein (multidrug efflux system)